MPKKVRKKLNIVKGYSRYLKAKQEALREGQPVTPWGRKSSNVKDATCESVSSHGEVDTLPPNEVRSVTFI